MDSPAVANVIACLALVVSIVALIVGVIASRQANTTQRRLIEIEEGRDAERVPEVRRAVLRAELREVGRHSERLYIINDGFAEARDVRVKLDRVPLAEHDAAVQNDQLSTVIGPRSEIICLLTTTAICAPPFGIAIAWQDNSGEAR